MVSKYGSHSQYSTEICEASHKPLTVGYHGTNRITVMPIILDTYTRNLHSLAFRELNIAHWSEDIEDFSVDICKVLRPTPRPVYIPLDLPPPISASQLLE